MSLPPVGPSHIPEEHKAVFEQLPHSNPFFDIKNAVRFVIPLETSYSKSLKSTELRELRTRKIEVIEKAHQLLVAREEALFVKSFHSLSREFLKDYRKYFPHKQIEALVSPRGARGPSHKRTNTNLDSPRARSAIMEQEKIATTYFWQFYLLSKQYLEAVAEEGPAELAPRGASQSGRGRS